MKKSAEQQRRSLMATEEQNPMGAKTQNKGNEDRGRRTGAVGKRRKSSVKDGLRDWITRKPIETNNKYAALNHTELLDNEKDHIMIKICIQTSNGEQDINAMVDSGATENFIDRGFCNKSNIGTKKAQKTKHIRMADGELRSEEHTSELQSQS